MLDPKMEQRLNQHINEELEAFYLYLAMAAHFKTQGLDGFAHWMRMQSQEEFGHAIKIYDYIHEHGGRVVLQAIAEPQVKCGSHIETFEQVLAHEQNVTTQINALADLAIKLNDHATNVFLHWFVTEQVEEESTAGSVLQKVKMVGDHGPGILALDRHLVSRVTE